jgi:8-oxo-dGTP pyrophosphatase MutT (NUDIX family)
MLTAERLHAHVQRLQELAERLQRRVHQPIPPGLVPVWMAGAQVGSTTPDVARVLAHPPSGFLLLDDALLLQDDDLDATGRTALLGKAALRLRDAGLLTGWRDEALAIHARRGDAPIAAIERAACRPLGIRTDAVHLNAFIDDETLVVARRAAGKQIDPGLWDNLVGGMVPAGESLEQALTREAWEEAGIEPGRLAIQRGRRFHVRRPVPEGLQSEIIHVFDATLPADLPLQNRDGEVAAIEQRRLPEVIAAIERDEFTLESALVTLDALARRAGIATPAGLYY